MSMRQFERLSGPSLNEPPACRCGKGMHIGTLRQRGDTHIRVYNCSACHHGMWRARFVYDAVLTNASQDGRTDVGTRWQPVSIGPHRARSRPAAKALAP